MLKFKQIKAITDLILEAELIVMGNEVSDIIGMSKKGNREEDIKAKIDAFLSSLIENDVLNKVKEDPQLLQQLSQAFLNVEWIELLDKYSDFISQLLKFETEELERLIKEGQDTELQRLRLKAYKGRLGVIWKTYQTIGKDKWNDRVTALLDKIKNKFTEQKTTETTVSTALVKTSVAAMKGSKPEDPNYAETVSKAIQIAQILYDFTGKGRDAAEDAEFKADSTDSQREPKEEKKESPIEDIEYEEVRDNQEDIKTEAYKTKIAELEALINDLKQNATNFNNTTGGSAVQLGKRDVIIRNAIEELRNWSEFETLESQFAKVRTTIMGDEFEIDPATGRRVRVIKLEDSAKKAYMAMAAEAYLEAKSRLSEFKTDLQLELYDGVSYSPEINLPLFKKTQIPITSKQMAEASRIQYLIKGLSFIGSLFDGGEMPGEQQKAIGETLLRFRKAILPVIGRTTSKIARKIGGKEAQLKAEKWTRILFTSEDSGLDQPKSKIKNTMDGAPGKKIGESAVAPGMAAQVPASISGMGDPVAPTHTSTGSGDNFNPAKKGKNRNIGSFNQFIKNLNKK